MSAPKPVLPVLAVALVAALLSAPSAGADTECFDATITGSFWDVSSSVKRNKRTVEHTGNPKDSDAGDLANLWTSSTTISRGTDHDLELDGAFRGLLTDVDWYRDSSRCASLTVTPLTASVTFPKIYGVCGPQATLDVPVTFKSVWRTGSGGVGQYLPKLVVKPRAAANLSCGLSCLAEVWGGLWATFEFTVKPFASAPGDALERTVYLEAGPQAGANLACFSVWGWQETLAHHEVVLNYDFF